MRKFFAAVLALCLLLTLWGCTGNALQNTVSFYYPRKTDTITYGAADSVMAAESRELPGREEDLSYLLTLYLSGPLDDTLCSPFPQGTVLEEVIFRPEGVIISLSGEFSQLSGIDLTIACACISATCFDFTDAGKVTVISPETDLYTAVNMTLTRESLTLIDEGAALSTDPK